MSTWFHPRTRTLSGVVPQILAATLIAARAGLHVPLVYNTGGYDSLETLALLDGVVDIYMPDMKYGDADVGERYSGVSEYPAINQAAVAEMHRQVGDLALDERGIALRGLLVRHLVLPEGLAGTAEVVSFLAGLSPNTYLNVMDQYRPCHEAHRLPPLDRRITRAEYLDAVRRARCAWPTKRACTASTMRRKMNRAHTTWRTCRCVRSLGARGSFSIPLLSILLRSPPWPLPPSGCAPRAFQRSISGAA